MPLSTEQFSNFALSVLVGGAGGANTPMNPGDTQFTLNSGAGNALFPATSGGSFRVLAGTWSGPHEVMLCTVRTGDVFTVTRAQEGTTAQTWQPGTIIQQVATAGSLSSLWKGLNSGRVFYVDDYGAVADGVTDSTSAIAACRSAANVAGGGEVRYSAGTYISGPQTIYTTVYDRGAGIGATVIMLKNGSNADLFSALTANINLFGTGGTGSSSAVFLFGFADLTLDGNYANQASGPCYPLRFYGYGYQLVNVEVRNGYSGGILCDYNGPFPSTGSGPATESNNWVLESTWINVKCHHNLGTTTSIGIEMGGPHDSRFTNVLSYHNNSHSFHSGNNNGGLQAVGCHMWQSGLADTASCTWLQEGSLYAVGCEAEGSPYAQLVILSTEVTWHGGSVYAGSTTGLGIQLGQQAGNTPYTNSVRQSAGLTTALQVFTYAIDTLVMFITHASGALWFANDGGGLVRASILAAAAGNTIYSGTPSTSTTLQLNNHGFSDARQQIWQMNGLVALGSTASSTDPGNNGTINTAGVTNVLITPAANETGLILQAGTANGQVVTVTNRSSGFAVTFAAKATSNVAEGTNCTIAPLTSASFVFYTLDSTWYRIAFAPGMTNTQADPGSAGTINTAGLRNVLITPGAAETGLILQAGTIAGQRITVFNRSASNSMTFAAAATSNVADGTSSVIAALTAATFIWSSADSRWFHAK